MRVVDEAQHGPSVGQFGQQRETRGKDEEALVRAALIEPQRDAESRRLRRGQPLDVMESRPQELVQAGIGELELGLHSTRLEHVHVRGPLAGVLEQSGLADARLAAQDERPAPRPAGVLEQRPDLGALAIAPVQHGPILRRGPFSL